MFFDEAYCEYYYRSTSIDNFSFDADCLIIVGTALATSFAKRITFDMAKNLMPIIEVNLEPTIDLENVFKL